MQRSAQQPIDMPAPVTAAIEARLSDALDTRVTVTRSTYHGDAVSFAPDRVFWHVAAEFDGPDGAPCSRAFLAKAARSEGNGQTDARRVDTFLSGRGLPVPDYYGSAAAAGWRVRLWDFCEGRFESRFANYSPEEIERLVRAIASIAAGTSDIGAANLRIPTGVKWGVPCAAELRDRIAGARGFAGYERRVEEFAAIEAELIRTLEAMEPRVLNHNDLKAPNVVLGDDRLWIVDWDSASIGPPGASLRKFAHAPPELQDTVVATFVRTLRDHGMQVEHRDVMLAMRGQQMLWAIATGLRAGRLERLGRGLRLVEQVAQELEARRAVSPYPRPAPEWLKAEVRQFMARNRGRLYSPIPHPDFEGWPASRQTERFEVILPHLERGGGTALDVGTHFGTFAHWLEDHGYSVTAVEKSDRFAAIAREVRDLCGKRFRVVEGSVFELEDVRFDLVLALNIFHHFLKTEETFRALEHFLERLQCRTIIFQAHVASEKQMARAFRNMEQEEFARFVAERAGLTHVEEIGTEGPRKIFKLSKAAASAPAARTDIERDDIYLVPAQSYASQKQRGFIARRTSTPVILEPPIDWGADPFDDPNWCSKLHHWRMTDPILAEYYQRKDPALLREALDYALDWHRFHFVEGKEATYSWKDGATGIRALRVAYFLAVAKAGTVPTSAVELQALNEMADEHARRLQDDDFISMTNHGLFQVFGLNLIAEVAPERPACAGAKQYAAKKFRELLAKQFDERGVHLEHSPAYHFFASRLIRSLGGSRHFEDPEIARTLDNADRREPWLVFPDGTESRIGDSGGARRQVAAPTEPLVSLPDGREFLVGDLTGSGYAVVRTAGGPAESMIFMTGMANSGTHKHADDLGFELFEHGRRIIVDSGKYGYFRDAKRRYVQSASAHNTISLLDRHISPATIEMRRTSLVPVEVDGGCFKLAGEIRRPSLFRQQRTMYYDPGRFLVIHDRVETEAEEAAFVSSLHLAPELIPALASSGFTVDLDGQRSFGAVALGDGEEVTVDAVRGQESPLLGWISLKYGEVEPTTVVRAVARGRSRSLVWAIWLGDEWRDAAVAQGEIVSRSADLG